MKCLLSESVENPYSVGRNVRIRCDLGHHVLELSKAFPWRKMRPVKLYVSQHLVRNPTHGRRFVSAYNRANCIDENRRRYGLQNRTQSIGKHSVVSLTHQEISLHRD